jgi:hypothetical protein
MTRTRREAMMVVVTFTVVTDPYLPKLRSTMVLGCEAARC